MTFAKTPEQLLDEYRHEIAGMVVDAGFARGRDGEMALLLRSLMQKIDRRLMNLIAESRREAGTPEPPKNQPPKPHANGTANGAAQPQPRKATT